MGGRTLSAAISGGYPLGADAQGYYFLPLTRVYQAATGNLGALVAFRYSPPIALLFGPFHILPWSVFLIAIVGLETAALVWLARDWTLAFLGLPFVVYELWAGNINLLLAVVVVLGFRYPAMWSVVLLTKVTPGVGLLWFALRREWRSLGVALAATIAISTISFVLAPALWPEWATMLAADARLPVPVDAINLPLAVRLPIAAALVTWGASGNRRWTVPIAAMLASPVLWLNDLSLAVGAVPLWREARAHSDGRDTSRE